MAEKTTLWSRVHESETLGHLGNAPMVKLIPGEAAVPSAEPIAVGSSAA